MGDPDILIRARIHYYAREKYFHSMQLAAVEGIKRFSGDPAYKFYYGIGLVLEGRIQEGIRELDPLQGYSEVMLGALLALIHAHKACLTVDKEAVAALDAKLKDERKRADDQSLYFAGWIEIYHVLKHREIHSKNALQYFDNVLKTDPRSIEALFGKANIDREKMKVELCLQNWDQAIDETGDRILTTDSRNIEALRYKLLDKVCRLGDYKEAEVGLRRLYSEDKGILEVSSIFAEKAASIDPHNDLYMCEVGYQRLLRGKIKEAQRYYKAALKLDESSIMALSGIIACQIQEGQYELARGQLDFLKEVQTGSNQSEILYMSAVLRKLSNSVSEGGGDNALTILNEAVDVHFRSVRGFPFGIEYLKIMNPDYVSNLVKEYLLYVPSAATPSGSKTCPGLKDAHFLASKAKFLSGDTKSALNSLENILDKLDPSDSEAYLLMAQINMHEGDFSQAQKNLEIGLSFNFQVQNHPMYHLINAKVLKENESINEAVNTLKTALTILESKEPSSSSEKINFTSADKVSLYIELAECLRLSGHPNEALKVIQDAINEYKGTPEEIRIMVANADFALEKGDIETNEKMAKIYLKKRKDKRSYAQCYRTIVENSPTSQNYILLGDAYMGIQEPERALEVYEQDSLLAAKMGQALQKTHQYGKAINYYRDAMKQDNNNDLRFDMAQLQMKLKQYEKAEKTILLALELESNGNQNSDLLSLENQARSYTLLATIRERQRHPNGNMEAATKSLMNAKEIRTKMLKRVQVERPDSIQEQRQMVADICHRMAEYSISSREFDTAIQRYKEALQYYPEDETALCALARLYLTTDELDQCQYTLLDKRPDYWVALSRLVEVMRRTGCLEEVPEYLAKSEEYAAGASRIDPPGLSFCRAMYEWYSGNTYNALKLFNKARQDTEWDQRAVYNMIEICLNPDNQMLGGEVFESNGTVISGDSSSEETALNTAEKLLKELKPRLGQQMMSYQLLQGMLQLATKNKANIEKSLQDFMNIASTSSAQENRENVGAILGMATAYQLLKQTPKARNQLKRVAKYSWNFEDAEYLERCGKYDMATELIRKVFLHNKSSTKAYEYMGYIMEKESSYKDASQNYEQAWRFSNKSNPVIGYKLAFNYMKAKRYTDAIDISHEILSKFPNYPKVKKEILEKSRDSLKR
ncbi:TTC21B [Lepeophtheirus salmonis]|uniref:TTC21B n=1 Tax=Lepeophtheirus salmonis TaxID=72036 RepID=A0A7R8H830_LEPSM|nr:TTC21B [Lepeophtheirus salmonis]CAF2930049.1 TTC21B [Lepeophtheirus salmonis]